MTRDEHKDAWARAFKAAGHEFVMQEPDEDDEPGEESIDWFYTSGGMHNGPGCRKCGWSCCCHCTEISNIPQCKAVS